MSQVWILLGHPKRKPSELISVFQHYERGKTALDALAFMGCYNEVELKRVDVNREKKFTLKKVKS